MEIWLSRVTGQRMDNFGAFPWCGDWRKIISVSWSHRKSGPGPVTREGEWDRAVNIYSRDQYFANLRRKLGKNVQNCMWDNAKQGVLVTSNGWRVKISEWKLHAQSINKYWKHDMRPAFININLLEIWDIINGNYLYIYLEPPSSARRSLRLQKLCWAMTIGDVMT